MTTLRRSLATTGGAGVIAATVAFLPAWEGTDHVAKRDVVGTGHPITWCHGQTSADDPTVKVGQHFTDKECDEQLAKALPKYLEKIEPCIHVDMPDKTKASLLDAAWNAGPAAVCRSPMVVKMNNGDLEAGCNAFDMWYVRGDGNVLPGLIDRRAGELHGDHRKSERALCLEGLHEAKLVKPVEPLRPVAPVLSLPTVPTCACSKPTAPVVVPPPTKNVIALTPPKRCAQVWNVITKKEIKLCL